MTLMVKDELYLIPNALARNIVKGVFYGIILAITVYYACSRCNLSKEFNDKIGNFDDVESKKKVDSKIDSHLIGIQPV